MKVIKSIIIAGLLCVSNTQAMEQKENNSLGRMILNSLGAAYAAVYGGTIAHELGHAAADKIYHTKSKTIIYSDPFLKGGWCMAYNGSLTLAQKFSFMALINNILRAKPEDTQSSIALKKFMDTHTIKLLSNPTGLPAAGIFAAGPLAGLSYAALLPFLNTVGNEYVKSGSLHEAVQKARQKKYLNSDQNLGLVVGCLWSGLHDFVNALPLIKGSDGYRILEALKLNRPAIRYSVIGAPFVGLGLLGYNFLNFNKS